MRTSIATVCISGTLEDKLPPAPRPASTASRSSSPTSSRRRRPPSEIRRAAPTSGCRSTSTSRSATSIRRPETARGQPAAGRAQVRRHGGAGHRPDPGVLVGAADAVDDDAASPSSCTRWPSAPRARGVRLAYEALAWGRHVNTYERSWEIVRRADHPALGLCVDSFHILSRGSDPAGIRDIPGEKLFFLQLADAPHMDMDVLQWSRHHRLLPRPGRLRPARVPRPRARRRLHRAAVARGLQRRVPPGRPAPRRRRRPALAARARRGRPRPRPGGAPGERPRSGRDRALPDTPQLHGFAFAELAVDDDCGARRSRARGARLHPRRHRTAPSRSQLWSHGQARVLLNAPAGPRPEGAAVAAVGVEVDDPPAAAQRAHGAARPAAPPHPRSGRGGPVGRRRAGRHGGVLLPHGCRGRLAHWPTIPRTASSRCRVRVDLAHRPRRADPAVRQLRRGDAVLPQPAGPLDPARVGGRGPVRPGAQPDRRRPAADACGSG